MQLRTSNPIESVFASVRLRTDVAKRRGTQENALYSVFKIVRWPGQTWRALSGGQTLMGLVLRGERFVDGIHQPRKQETTQAA